MLYLSSDLISAFYQTNLVNGIINCICLGIVFGSIGSVHRALLIKNNRFKDITKIDIIAEVGSSIISILLAIYFSGLLAISTKYLVRPLLQSLLVFKFSKVKIKPKIYFQEIKAILLYSSNVLFSQIFMCLNNNIDFIIVGRYLGDKLLGFYTIAFQWGSLARYYLSGALIRVLFPEVSRIQNDRERLIGLYYKIIASLAFITMPICMGLVMVANEFILVLYGDRWLDVVPVLQLLLISGSISSITVVGGPILRGIGKPGVEMNLSLFSFLVFTLVLFSITKYGLIFVALAEAVRVVIIESARLILLKKHLKIGIWKFIRTLLPTIFCVLFMIFSIVIIDKFIFISSAYYMLLIKIIIGAISYFLISFLLNKPQLYSLLKYFKNRQTEKQV